MHDEMRKSLVPHYNKFPIAFPKSVDDDEWKMFELLDRIPDEEAEVLLNLRPYPEYIDDIAERMGRAKSELIPLLGSLQKKAWVLRMGSPEKGQYWTQCWGPGQYELLVDRYTPEYVQWITQKIVTPETILNIYGTPDMTPWFRILPREQSIPMNIEVYPYEMISHMIMETDQIALADCMCRTKAKLLGQGCDAPIDSMCMWFSFWAQAITDIGAGKLVSKDEALKTIKRAHNAGLIHEVTTTHEPLFLCNCCPCCCDPLVAALSILPYTTMHSNFVAEVNMELCTGCGDCIKTCYPNALELERKTEKAVLEVEKCIGCGLCVAACPHPGAITLQRKPTEEVKVVNSRTWHDWLALRAKESGRDEFYK